MKMTITSYMDRFDKRCQNCNAWVFVNEYFWEIEFDGNKFDTCINCMPGKIINELKKGNQYQGRGCDVK